MPHGTDESDFPPDPGLILGTAPPSPAQAPAGCAAFEEDTDGDGRPDRVVLENEFLRLVFTSDGFGRRFLYKPTGTDVLGGKSRMLFHWDVFEVPNSLRPRDPGAVAAGWQGTTRNMPRPVRVVRNTPEEAAIEMSLQMPAMVSRPEYDQVRLTLRLTLREGVNAVFGRNTAVNEAGQPQPITFRQGIRKYSPGVIWGTYVPDIEGPRVAMDLEPGPFSFPALSGTFPSAWIGGVNEQGFGLAVSTEWRVTDMVEAWCSKSPRASLQWAYRTRILEPGQPWSTDFTVAPFEGFEEVSGFQDGVAGQLEVGELDWERRSRPENKRRFPPLELAVGRAVPVEVRVAAVSGRDLTIEFGSRRLPEEDPLIEERAEVTVDAGSTAARSFTWTPASEGTHVVVARVLEGGEPVLLMEKPFVVGATDQAYFAAMPDQPQVGEATIGREVAEPPLGEAAVGLDLEAVDIPRKRFGRNYIHGPLRLLFVCQPKHDLVSARELYQRMDLVLDHLVVPEGNRGQSRKLVRRLTEQSPDGPLPLGLPVEQDAGPVAGGEHRRPGPRAAGHGAGHARAPGPPRRPEEPPVAVPGAGEPRGPGPLPRGDPGRAGARPPLHPRRRADRRHRRLRHLELRRRHLLPGRGPAAGLPPLGLRPERVDQGRPLGRGPRGRRPLRRLPPRGGGPHLPAGERRSARTRGP